MIESGLYADLLPPENRERFNKARAVGRAKIHMRNARDLMLKGYTAQADNELDAAEAALAKEWGA
jgi:hypothetical protein